MPGSVAHILAVQQRELREIARTRTPFVLRAVYGALAGVAVFGLLLASSDRMMSGADVAMISTWLFGTTVVLQSTAAVVLGLLLGVASVASEKRNRTLGLLVLSGLRHWEIVIGKLLSLVGIAVMVFAVTLPLLGIIGWGGGIDYDWLWKFLPLTLALIVFGCSIGLFFGMRYRSGAVATVWALLSAAILVMLPLPISLIDKSVASRMAEYWIFIAPAAVAGQGEISGFWSSLILTASFSLVAVVATIRDLPRAVSAGVGRGLRGSFESLDRTFERINIGGLRLDWRRRLGVRGNPVIWLTMMSGGLGRGRYWVRLVVLNVCISLLAGSWIAAGSGWAGSLVTMIVIVVFVVPLMAGAAAIAGEASRKSLSVLLASPLSARQIVGGKARGAMRLFGLALAPPLGILLVVSGLIGDSPPPEALLALIFFVAEGWCGFCLCLGASLFVDSPLRAGIAGVVLLGVANFMPALASGAVWATLTSEQGWAGLVFLVLLGGAVACGALVMMAEELSPGRSFLARIGLITLTAGVFTGIIGEVNQSVSNRVGNWLGTGTGLFFFSLYLAFLGWQIYRLIVDRFDDALGRSA